eukprot:7891864-Lingulodinium_polyedra.AAC.1
MQRASTKRQHEATRGNSNRLRLNRSKQEINKRQQESTRVNRNLHRFGRSQQIVNRIDRTQP